MDNCTCQKFAICHLRCLNHQIVLLLLVPSFKSNPIAINIVKIYRAFSSDGKISRLTEIKRTKNNDIVQSHDNHQVLLLVKISGKVGSTIVAAYGNALRKLCRIY